MLRSIVITICCIELFSCNQDDKISAEKVRSLNTSDTFLLDRPAVRTASDSLYYRDFLKVQQQIGISSLEKGFDSLQIRIWYGGYACGDRLITLTLIGHKWNAAVYTITSNLAELLKGWTDDSLIERLNYSAEMEKHFPASGWRKLISELFQLNVLTLPDMRKIKGLVKEPVSDGDWVLVEIATRKCYRGYSYSNPDLYIEKHPEAKKIVEICRLLEKELGLEDLCDLRLKKNAAALSKEKAAAKKDTIRPKEIIIDDRKPRSKQKN